MWVKNNEQKKNPPPKIRKNWAFQITWMLQVCPQIIRDFRKNNSRLFLQSQYVLWQSMGKRLGKASCKEVIESQSRRIKKKKKKNLCVPQNPKQQQVIVYKNRIFKDYSKYTRLKNNIYINAWILHHLYTRRIDIPKILSSSVHLVGLVHTSICSIKMSLKGNSETLLIQAIIIKHK